MRKIAVIDKETSVVANLTNEIAELFLRRANIYYASGKYEQCLNDARAATKESPTCAEAYLLAGLSLQILQRFDEALAAFYAAISINPNYANAHNNRGNILTHLKRFDEALAAVDAAIRIKPNDAGAHYNRGNILANLDRFDEALAAYDAAIRINPNYAKAHYNRGNTLANLKRFDEALAAIDAAIRINPNHAEARSNCLHALVLLKLNRCDEAFDLAKVLFNQKQVDFAKRVCDEIFQRNVSDELRVKCQTLYKEILLANNMSHDNLAEADASKVESFGEDLIALGARNGDNDPFTDIDLIADAVASSDNPKAALTRSAESSQLPLGQTFMPPPQEPRLKSRKIETDMRNTPG